jgi:hypothetical protein
MQGTSFQKKMCKGNMFNYFSVLALRSSSLRLSDEPDRPAGNGTLDAGGSGAGSGVDLRADSGDHASRLSPSSEPSVSLTCGCACWGSSGGAMLETVRFDVAGAVPAASRLGLLVAAAALRGVDPPDLLALLGRRDAGRAEGAAQAVGERLPASTGGACELLLNDCGVVCSSFASGTDCSTGAFGSL